MGERTTEIELRFLSAMSDRKQQLGGHPTPSGEVAILEAGVRELVEILEEQEHLIHLLEHRSETVGRQDLDIRKQEDREEIFRNTEYFSIVVRASGMERTLCVPMRSDFGSPILPSEFIRTGLADIWWKRISREVEQALRECGE